MLFCLNSDLSMPIPAVCIYVRNADIDPVGQGQNLYQ